MSDFKIENINVYDLAVGSLLIDRYEIVQLLGRGGMASIYLVKDHNKDNREIALKILHKEFSRDKVHLERFIREVQVLLSIDNDYILKTYDLHQVEDMIFCTMEYIRGYSLVELMKQKQFSMIELLGLIKKICLGLEAIHSRDIVHRDLKPDNIMIDGEETLKIIDFGVARPLESRLTQKFQALGSLAYIAPEIWAGKKATPASDLYSLGVMLYELCTGVLPYVSEDPSSLMKEHESVKLALPSTINKSLPVWLDKLTARLLAKNLKDRFQSAREVLISIEELIEEEGPKVTVRDSDLMSKTTISLPVLERGKTYIFNLSATKVFNSITSVDSSALSKNRKTIVIPLPKRSALIFEIQKPSKDFYFFGLFLISLQFFDFFLTREGIRKHGIEAEGNYLLRSFMEEYEPEQVLFWAKLIAIIFVIFLTIAARKMKWIKDIISFLSYFYIIMAILPWMYLLYFRW